MNSCHNSRIEYVVERRAAQGDAQSYVSFLLAEHGAVRAEIVSRLNAQATVLGMVLTAVGIIAGIVLSKKGSPQLLLVIPVVAPSLGLFYIDQMLHMGILSLHLRGEVLTSLRKVFLGRPVPLWEHSWALYNDRSNHRSRSRYLLLVALAVMPPGAVFFLSSVVCLAFTVERAFYTVAYGVVWILGCLLTLSLPIAASLIAPQHRDDGLRDVLTKL